MVYKARDRERDDFVALKILSDSTPAAELERFKALVKDSRRLAHDNVVRTFDAGTFGGQPFVASEYVRGLTLRALLEYSGRMPSAAGLRLAKQLAAALAAIHQGDLVHGGVRSSNLIVEPAGKAKLMEFGFVTTVDDSSDLGLLSYAAPELLRGEEASAESDLYAAGVLLYELFTGRKPFSGSSAEELSQAHLEEPPVAPSSLWGGMPPSLEKVILRLLEKSPTRRVSSSEELRTILDGISV